MSKLAHVLLGRRCAQKKKKKVQAAPGLTVMVPTPLRSLGTQDWSMTNLARSAYSSNSYIDDMLGWVIRKGKMSHAATDLLKVDCLHSG